MFLLLALALTPLAVAETPTPWCEAEKALYAWNCATEKREGVSAWTHLLLDTNGCAGRLVDFSVSQRFDRVYLFMGAMEWHWNAYFSQGHLPEEEALAALTTRLRAAGVEPWALWYLNDDPDNLSGSEHVADLVSSVSAFNQAYPDGAFAGLHGDQEPNDPDTYDAYLEMNRLGLETATAQGLAWGGSLKPGWLTTPRDAPLMPEVLPNLSNGTLMDYTDDPDKAASQGETFLAFAEAAGVPGEVAVETGWGDPTPGVSFSDLLSSDAEGFFAMLGTLDEGFRAHGERYEGIVVHDFAQYFAGLYGGVEPYDFVGTVEVLCPSAEEPDDSGVSDSGGSDSGISDSGMPDSGALDSGMADSGMADTAEPVDSATSSSDSEAKDEGGCGCGTAAPRGGGLLALLLLPWRRRGRGTERTSPKGAREG